LKTLRVRLTKSLGGMAGNAYPEGSVVLAVFALDGVPEDVGTGYVPLSSGEWEPALTDECLDRLLEGS
jgi:hypothetical protein